MSQYKEGQVVHLSLKETEKIFDAKFNIREKYDVDDLAQNFLNKIANLQQEGVVRSPIAHPVTFCTVVEGNKKTDKGVGGFKRVRAAKKVSIDHPEFTPYVETVPAVYLGEMSERQRMDLLTEHSTEEALSFSELYEAIATRLRIGKPLWGQTTLINMFSNSLMANLPKGRRDSLKEKMSKLSPDDAGKLLRDTVKREFQNIQRVQQISDVVGDQAREIFFNKEMSRNGITFTQKQWENLTKKLGNERNASGQLLREAEPDVYGEKPVKQLFKTYLEEAEQKAKAKEEGTDTPKETPLSKADLDSQIQNYANCPAIACALRAARGSKEALEELPTHKKELLEYYAIKEQNAKELEKLKEQALKQAS